MGRTGKCQEGKYDKGSNVGFRRRNTSNKGSMELLRHVPCSVTATQEKKKKAAI